MNLTVTMQIFWCMVKCLANISLVFNIKYKKHVCVYVYMYVLHPTTIRASSPLKTAIVSSDCISAGAAVVSLRQ